MSQGYRIVVYIMIGCVLGYVGIYWVGRPGRIPRTSPETRCLANIKSCIMAQYIYSVDHDDRLPLATSWMDSIQKYDDDPKRLTCPLVETEGGEYGYAMVFGMSSASVSKTPKPEDQPVLFDSILIARNATSGFYGFPESKKRKTHVTYLDGHVAGLKR